MMCCRVASVFSPAAVSVEDSRTVGGDAGGTTRAVCWSTSRLHPRLLHGFISIRTPSRQVQGHDGTYKYTIPVSDNTQKPMI